MIVMTAVLGSAMAATLFAYKKWQPQIEEEITRKERAELKKIVRN